MTTNKLRVGDKVLWAGEHAEVKVAEPDEKGWLVLLTKAAGYMLAHESTLSPAPVTHLWGGVEWEVVETRLPEKDDTYWNNEVRIAGQSFSATAYPILRPVRIVAQKEGAWRPNTANQAARSHGDQDKEGA